MAPKKTKRIRTDRRPVTPLDSEDEAGTYADPRSPDDTGESDDGVLTHAPHFRAAKYPPSPKKEASR